MMMLGPLVLVMIGVVGALVYALTRVRAGAASAGVDASTSSPLRAVPGAMPPRPELREELSGWVAAGLLSEEQASAIEAHEWARPRPAPTPRPVPSAPAGAPRPRRIPVVAEALGYLGGMLLIVGLGLVVARYWPDMATAGRLALSGGAAVVLLGGGALVREESDPALARLRWFVWLAATAAAGLFAGVLSAGALGLGVESVVMVCAGAVAVESGLLWWWRPRPLQQLTCLGGSAVFVGALMHLFAPDAAVGLAVWAVGATYLALGLRRRTPLPLLTEGVGALTVVAGAGITSGAQAFGLIFLVATAIGLLSLATVPGLAPEWTDQVITGVVGGLALLQGLPPTLAYFAHESGVATGLATWLAGGALVFVGARHLVRLPLVAQGLGAAALIGGAALTGVQWHGFAPIFGIVTAIGLIGLGMLPGQVLLSVFGSLGLLINVPWAVSWFFPGEGRAPLLILVCGGLILGVAVWMTRMGSRFRQDLGGPRHGAPRPPGGMMPRPSH